MSTGGKSSGSKKCINKETKELQCPICNQVVSLRANSVACEACKKFFMRNYDPEKRLVCPNDGMCLDSKAGKGNRRSCPACRLQKCIEANLIDKVKPSKPSVDLRYVPCKVCGASSTGYHFGVLSCEGCKGFYRRSVKFSLVKSYSCDKKSQCMLDPLASKCKKCRYERCVQAGMSPNGSHIGRQTNAQRANTKREIERLQIEKKLLKTPIMVRQMKRAIQSSEPDVKEEASLTSFPITEESASNSPAIKKRLHSPSDLHEPFVNVENNSSDDSHNTAMLPPSTSTGFMTDGCHSFESSPFSGTEYKEQERDHGSTSPSSFPCSSNTEDHAIFQEATEDFPHRLMLIDNSRHAVINRISTPVAPSELIWLQNSGADWVKLADFIKPSPQLGTLKNIRPTVSDIVSLLVPHRPSPGPDLSFTHRNEWKLAQITNAARNLNYIKDLRIHFDPGWQADEVWRQGMVCFEHHTRYVLAFVRSLPGKFHLNLIEVERLFVYFVF